MAEAGYCDCGLEIRGLHHLFIVENHAVLGLGFLPHFPHYFIFFLSFWRFLDIFRGKEGFMAFWRHFKPFGDFLDGFLGF